MPRRKQSNPQPVKIESEDGCEHNGPEELVLESDLMLGQELEFEDSDEKIMGFEKDSEDSVVSEFGGLVNGSDEFPPSYKRLKTEDEADNYIHTKSIEAEANSEMFIPFSCQQCGLMLDSNPQQLDRMTGQNCPKCSLESLSVEDVTSDQAEKLFSCRLCRFISQYPNHLARHMKTHSGEKPYKCLHCDHASAQPENLKRHMRTHTGEKPFKCKDCDYACSNMTNLKRHQRIHSGNKPFKCDTCNYSCNQSINLKRHMLRHTDQTPFKTPECNVSKHFFS